MKLRYKKLASALFALGLTSTATAAVGNDASSEQNSAWSFGFDYLLLQPVSNGLDFSGNTFGVPGVADSLEPGFNKSAIRLAAGYELGDGRDVNLNWIHLFGGNTSENFELESDLFTLDVNGKYKFDAVNLELGQTIVTGQRSNIRIFGGLQFARIGTELSGTLNVLDNDGDVTDSTALGSYESNLFAIGPRLGVEGNYQIVDNVSVVASAATSLLVGSLKTKDIDNEGVSTETYDKRTIVPGFEGKLGLRYSQAVGNDGTVSAELGYQVASYINAVKSQAGNTENFGLQGAYLSLKWTGDLV